MSGKTARPPKRESAFLAVCGHTNLDVLLQVKELPAPGASVLVLHRRTAWGGTACNVARHAAGLGVGVRLWSRVGEDFPDGWRRALGGDGVDLSFLDVVKGAQTPTCFVLTDLLDRQSYCMDQGPMAEMAENPPPPGLVEGLAPGGWLHLATGDPPAYAAIAQEAKERGVHVALDPGQELRFMYDERSLRGLLAFADVFFLNGFEQQVACGLLGLGDPVDLLEHVDTVVVTLGPRGALLRRRGKPDLHQSAFPVPRLVDPTGAGDALRAGWYAALRDGRTMEAALQWGQAAAAVVVQHPGPQEHVVRPEEVRAVVGKGGAPP